jgi:hypothetical protein
MSLINTLEIIPYALYEKLKKGHVGAIIRDAEDSRSKLESFLGGGFPPHFSSTMFLLRDFLTFPYIQQASDSPFSFEIEFLRRIGTALQLLDVYSEGESYSVNFLVDQIEQLVKDVETQKIELRFITEEEFKMRTVKASGKQFNSQIFSNKFDNKVKEINIPEYHLNVTKRDDVGFNLFDSQLEESETEKDKFLILHELGIIDFLDQNWGWQGLVGVDGNLESVGSIEKRYAKLLCKFFQLKKPETVRTYLRDLKNRPQSFYPEKKAEEVKQIINNLGITKLPDHSKKG